MTFQTTIAAFDNQTEVDKTIDDLVEAGIARSSIKVMPEAGTSAGAIGSMDPADGTMREEKGFWASLGDLFMPDEDRTSYTEAGERGSILMSVTVEQSETARVEDILQEFGTVDPDASETPAVGWSGDPDGADMDKTTHPAVGWSGDAQPVGTGAGQADGRTPEGAEALSVVEEAMQVGKRQVSGGRVKIRSYVVETPVSDDVSLRSESVEVERRPVDRSVQAGENPFQDRTIEAEATSEEAVVSKTARVTEEIVLKKTAGERTETVSDTVRSTKVDVEEDRDPVARKTPDPRVL